MTVTPPAPSTRIGDSRVAAVIAWAALGVFVVLAIGPALLGRGVFLGTDLLQSVAPWNGQSSAPADIQNRLLGDTVDSLMPQIDLVHSSLADGELPQWNPYVAGGTTLASVPDTSAFSPLSWPELVAPGPYAPGLVKLFEIIAVATGMSLLLRRWGLPSSAWAVASLVYVSSGFMVSWTNWPHTRVAALIPLLFWAIDRCVLERRGRDVLAIALVLVSMLLGGFPAVTGYALYAGTAYGLVRAVAERLRLVEMVRAVVVAGLGLAVAVGLAAWQLAPFAFQALNVVDFSVRKQSGGSGTLPLHDLATTVVPDILGQVGGTWWGGAANPVERLSYLGVVTLVLVGLGVVLRPRVWRAPRGITPFVVVSALLCVVLLFVGGEPLALLQHLPIFSNNPVARLRVMLGFFVALAAAIGYSAILAGRRESDRTRPAGWRGVVRAPQTWLALGVAACAVGLAVLVRKALYLAPATGIQMARHATIVAAAVGVCALVACVAVWWVRPGRVMRIVALTAVSALMVAPAAGLVGEWWTVSPVQSYYPVTPAHRFLAEHLGEDRYVSVDQAMLPGTSSLYQLREATGHGFETQQWKDLLTAVDPGAMLTPTYSSLHSGQLATSVVSPILDRLAVKYVVVNPASDLLGTVEPVPTAAAAPTLRTGEAVPVAQITGPLRGVLVTFAAGMDVPDGVGSTVTASLVDASGKVIASNARQVTNDLGGGATLTFALTGEDIGAADVSTLELTTTATSAPVQLAPSAAGDPWLRVVRPADDGVRVAFTDGATIYERLNVMDRVRWAGRSIVEDSPAARVADLATPSLPRDTVVLQDSGLDGVASTGAHGTATVRPGGPDSVTVDVDSDGAGWLVVNDDWAGGGWHASVDGVSSPAVVADHVGRAVQVPAGKHTVTFTYRAPGLRAGVALTLATLVALLVGGVVFFLRSRRTRGPKAEGRPDTPGVDRDRP